MIDDEIKVDNCNQGKETLDLKQWVDQLYIGIGDAVETKRKEILDKFKKSDYDTLELVFDCVTNERLKKKVEIEQASDRNKIIKSCL